MNVYCFLRASAKKSGFRYALELSRRTQTKLFIYNASFPTKENNIVYLKFLPFSTVGFSDLIYFPFKFRKLHADLYHAYSPTATIPLLISNRRPVIVTYHDLWRIFPPNLNDIKVPVIRLIQRIATMADFILTVSNSTKADLCHFFKVPAEKVEHVYLGVNEKFRVIGKKEDVKKELGIQNSFIFTVAAVEQRKNFITSIKAFYKLRKRFENLKFFIAGEATFPYFYTISKLIRELGLEKSVVFLGNVPDEKLIMFYNAADVLVFPSLYEGFGLPLLEAMACGTPVVTSNRSSLPEVAGDAGVLVNALDVNEIEGAMFRILTEDGFRQDLIRRGLKRVKFFTWEKTAEETSKIYEEVLDGKK